MADRIELPLVLNAADTEVSSLLEIIEVLAALMMQRTADRTPSDNPRLTQLVEQTLGPMSMILVETAQGMLNDAPPEIRLIVLKELVNEMKRPFARLGIAVSIDGTSVMAWEEG